MEIVQILDDRLTFATQLFFFALGVWGLIRAVRGQSVDGNYVGAIFVGEILYIGLVILDLILWLGGIVPERASLHYLYALFAVLLTPFIYASVLKGDESNQAQWIYTFTSFFLFGVAARALTTSF